MEERWESLTMNVRQATEKVTGYINRKAKKCWLTEEILDRMKERRIAKLKSPTDQCNIIHRNIHNKIRQAKEMWREEQYQKEERLHEKHDSFHFHKKSK